MYKHLKERQYYEDIYDKITVEDARRYMGAGLKRLQAANVGSWSV